MFLRYEIRTSDPQYIAQLFCGHLERTGRRRLARRRLRKCRGHGRVEGDIAFDFLHHLVYVAIQDRD